jgi:citrate synthase
MEQYDDNRIYRPRARYIGPTKQVYEPIETR